MPEKEPNAEMIFHFSKYGNGVAGHCELCIDGRTYTYGNYDPDSRILFRTAGNGIIIRAKKEDYIDWIISSNHKMVIVYGLRLNDEQMVSLRENLKIFDECMVSWDKEAKHTVSSEFIKKVTLNIDADIYKITKGRFKTYFLPTINCVTLTDSFLKNTPIGRTILPGISTPGSYLDILQRQYDTGSDFVVSLKTYGIK